MKIKWEEIINKKYILNNVSYKLANKEFNEEILDKIPYFSYFDVIVMFVVIDEEREAHFLLTNDILNVFGITIKEICIAADENMKVSEIKTSYLSQLLGCAGIFGCPPMCVTTNKNHFLGASALLYPHLFLPAANEFNANLYILPASIHELIAVPHRPEFEVNDLKELVSNVNNDAVSPEEKLSDSVYIFDREKVTISIA